MGAALIGFVSSGGLTRGRRIGEGTKDVETVTVRCRLAWGEAFVEVGDDGSGIGDIGIVEEYLGLAPPELLGLEGAKLAEGNGFVLYNVLELDAAEDVPGGVEQDVEGLELQRGFRGDLDHEAGFELAELVLLPGRDEDSGTGESGGCGVGAIGVDLCLGR